MTDLKKCAQTFKDESMELVLSSARVIAEVAKNLGINEGTLGNWVCKCGEDHPERFTGTAKSPRHQRA